MRAPQPPQKRARGRCTGDYPPLCTPGSPSPRVPRAGTVGDRHQRVASERLCCFQRLAAHSGEAEPARTLDASSTVCLAVSPARASSSFPPRTSPRPLSWRRLAPSWRVRGASHLSSSFLGICSPAAASLTAPPKLTDLMREPFPRPPPDQQVLRGLPGRPLLRRQRVHRPG